MLAINTTGSLVFCSAANWVSRINNLCERKRKLSDPTMPTDRAGAYALFTETFLRRMPLINQDSTIMLERRENLLNRQNHFKTETSVFFTSIFERIGRTEKETVFVSFAATLESWWIEGCLPRAVAWLHTVVFLYSESWTAIRYPFDGQSTNDCHFPALIYTEYVCNERMDSKSVCLLHTALLVEAWILLSCYNAFLSLCDRGVCCLCRSPGESIWFERCDIPALDAS